MTKSSSMHTVPGYRILSSSYFVQLTNLKSPNLDTHYVEKTNNTQLSTSTANLVSHANKCTNIKWQNSLETYRDSQSRLY